MWRIGDIGPGLFGSPSCAWFAPLFVVLEPASGFGVDSVIVSLAAARVFAVDFVGADRLSFPTGRFEVSGFCVVLSGLGSAFCVAALSFGGPILFFPMGVGGSLAVPYRCETSGYCERGKVWKPALGGGRSRRHVSAAGTTGCGAVSRMIEDPKGHSRLLDMIWWK